MSDDAILDEQLLSEEGDEPVTLEDLILHLVEDLTAGVGAGAIADEFVTEFVQAGRPETDQVLMLLDQPTPILVVALKALVQQTHEAAIMAIDTKGPAFADDLKEAVKVRLKELAAAN